MKMGSLLNRPKGASALPVGDEEQFVLAAVERGGLQPSPKLLAVSDVVPVAPASGDR